MKLKACESHRNLESERVGLRVLSLFFAVVSLVSRNSAVRNFYNLRGNVGRGCRGLLVGVFEACAGKETRRTVEVRRLLKTRRSPRKQAAGKRNAPRQRIVCELTRDIATLGEI